MRGRLFERLAWLRRAEGQMLVLGALFFPVVLAAAGLAIDTGLLAHTRTEVQKDVDAMALAGAQSLCGTTGYVTCESNADTAARAVGTSNGVTGSDTIVITFGTTCNGTTSSNHDVITVRVTRNQPTYLVRVIGFNSGNITTCATAQKSEIVGYTGGIRPFALEDTCITGVTYGSQVTMKYDSGGGGSTCTSSQGNFGALDIGGNGSSGYRDAIEYGVSTTLCADTAPGCTNYTQATKPGNMTGPTRTGVDYLTTNAPASCNTWAEVSNASYGIQPAYNPFLSSYAGTSSQIIIIPIVHGLWSSGGTHDVTIKGFAVVFLTGYSGGCSGNNCDIQGYFMKATLTLSGATKGTLDSSSTITAVSLIN